MHVRDSLRSHPARCPMERLLIPPGVPSRLSRPNRLRPRLRRAQESGWDISLVKLAFGDCSPLQVHSSVSIEQAQAAVIRAAESWNKVALPIKFLVDAADLLATDVVVVVRWEFSSQDAESILNGQVHAHADYPPPNTLFGGPPMPLHFNADMLWGVEEPGCYDIETVALHELAHILGLIYHSGPDTILFDAIGPAPVFVQHRLDRETIQRAERLYGR